MGWSQSEPGKEAVTGIDDGRVHIFTWGDGAAFVIWGENSGGGGTAPRQAGDPRGSARYYCTLGDVRVEGLTPDGRTGTVKIGAESYDLAKGRLFLVSIKDAKPRVKQISLAKLDLKPEGKSTPEEVTTEQLKELAKTDADIQSFFIGAGAGEQSAK